MCLIWMHLHRVIIGEIASVVLRGSFLLLLFFLFLWLQIIWDISCQHNQRVSYFAWRWRRGEEDRQRWRGWQQRWKENTLNNRPLTPYNMRICVHHLTCTADHLHQNARRSVCTCTRCMYALSPRVVEDEVRSMTLCRAPPAACQGWRLLPWDLWLSHPNCSQASKIKSPWDPFAWAGEPRTDNASQTPHWHFHGWSFFFFFIFLSFYIHFFFFTSASTFGEFSQ